MYVVISRSAGREWLSLRMSLKTVGDIDEALDFIAVHGSQHSECIVAENREATEQFLNNVDAACVYRCRLQRVASWH